MTFLRRKNGFVWVLFVCLSDVSVFVCLFVCLICLFVCLFVCSSVCLLVWEKIRDIVLQWNLWCFIHRFPGGSKKIIEASELCHGAWDKRWRTRMIHVFPSSPYGSWHLGLGDLEVDIEKE